MKTCGQTVVKTSHIAVTAVRAGDIAVTAARAGDVAVRLGHVFRHRDDMRDHRSSKL